MAEFRPSWEPAAGGGGSSRYVQGAGRPPGHLACSRPAANVRNHMPTKTNKQTIKIQVQAGDTPLG